MKILLITTNLNKISRHILESYQICGIVESAPRNDSKLYRLGRRVILSIRKNNLRTYAKKKGIPYYFLNKNDDQNFIQWMKMLSPDIGTVNGMTYLLKPTLLNIPKYGFINIHPSLLPKYRGPNPIFWQYFNLDKTFGVTVHFLDEGEDTGDIIKQTGLEVQLGENFQTISDRIATEAIKLFDEVMKDFPEIKRIKQPTQSPTKRAKRVTSRDFKSLLDFEKFNTQEIWHIIRGAPTLFNESFSNKGFLLTPYKYEIVAHDKKPGIMHKDRTKGYYLATKDGKIFIRRKFNFINFILSLLDK